MIKGWGEINFKEELKKYYTEKILIENNANCQAISEQYFTQTCNVKNYVTIIEKLPAAVGMGIVINNEIYRWASATAGEVAHIIVDYNGELCCCGNKGCFQTISSLQSFFRIIKDYLSKGVDSILRDLCNDNFEKLSLHTIEEALKREDKLVRNAIEDFGEMWSIGIVNIVNLFNPGKVILAGDLLNLGELFLNTIKKGVIRRAVPSALNKLDIVFSSFNEYGIAIGSALLLKDEILNLYF